MDKFQSLQQAHTIAQYIDQFEENLVLLKRDNPYLQKSFSIASFIRDHKPDFKQFVIFHQPQTLMNAYWYARHLEQVE